MLVTLDVLKLSPNMIFPNPAHPENIYDMSVTFSVLKPLKSKVVKAEHTLNIPLILVTLVVFKFSIFYIVVNTVQSGNHNFKLLGTISFTNVTLFIFVMSLYHGINSFVVNSFPFIFSYSISTSFPSIFSVLLLNPNVPSVYNVGYISVNSTDASSSKLSFNIIFHFF